MTDEERQYELVDPRGFVHTKHVDVDMVSCLPASDRDRGRGGEDAGYENVVAINSRDGHTYESTLPACSINGPRMRAKVNEIYESVNPEDCITNTKIFEAIRNLDHPTEQKKGQCQLGCFAVFSLILFSVMSLSASGYVFYKVEIQKSSRCNCPAYSKGKLKFYPTDMYESISQSANVG